MKKILIIGGCGYIGSAIYSKLKSKYEITTVDLEWFGNFNNPDNLKVDYDSLAKDFLNQFDVVILTAAHSSVAMCTDLYGTVENNISKFIRLVGKLNKQKFIYASSSCVYVQSGKKAKTEQDFLLPMDGLTLSKTTIDHFMAMTDVEYYSLRLGNINGWSPNLRLDLMINAMSLSAINNKCVKVFNGESYRPILFIEDLAAVIDTIIENPADLRGVYNVAALNLPIKDIGQEVADFFEVPLIDTGNTFTYDFSIDSSKFIEAFNYKFMTSIPGIANSILVKEINPAWQGRPALEI